MPKKETCKYRTGDRVDFGYPGEAPRGTPGTIISRVHGAPTPTYRVRWDDGNIDNEVYVETDLVKVIGSDS